MKHLIKEFCIGSIDDVMKIKEKNKKNFIDLKLVLIWNLVVIHQQKKPLILLKIIIKNIPKL